VTDDKFKKRAIYQNFNCVDCGARVQNVAHKQTMPICILCFNERGWVADPILVHSVFGPGVKIPDLRQKH
jgi:hypothetical protein